MDEREGHIMGLPTCGAGSMFGFEAYSQKIPRRYARSRGELATHSSFIIIWWLWRVGDVLKNLWKIPVIVIPPKHLVGKGHGMLFGISYWIISCPFFLGETSSLCNGSSAFS